MSFIVQNNSLSFNFYLFVTLKVNDVVRVCSIPNLLNFHLRYISCQQICNYEELGYVDLALGIVWSDPTRACLSHGSRMVRSIKNRVTIVVETIINEFARNESKIDGRQKNRRIMGSRCPRELTLEHPLVCNRVTSQPHAQPPLRNGMGYSLICWVGHRAYSLVEFIKCGGDAC